MNTLNNPNLLIMPIGSVELRGLIFAVTCPLSDDAAVVFRRTNRVVDQLSG